MRKDYEVRNKKMGGGMSKLNPGLRKFMMAKKKAK